jgi:hypothetical protein
MQFIHIKRFMDKMSAVEARQNKDVVLSITDARGLRDDVSRLLADLYAMSADQPQREEITEVQVKGGSFR